MSFHTVLSFAIFGVILPASDGEKCTFNPSNRHMKGKMPCSLRCSRLYAILLIAAAVSVGCTGNPKKNGANENTNAAPENVGTHGSSELLTSAAREPSSKRINENVYSTQPFEIRTENLPPEYRGVDLAQLSGALLDLQSKSNKDEFETTEQYRQRLRTLNSTALLGSLKLDSLYAFSFAPTDTNYDADAQILNVLLSANYSGEHDGFGWNAYRLKGENYSAKNALGVEVEVSSEHVLSYYLIIRNAQEFALQRNDLWTTFIVKIPIGQEKAKALKSSVRLLFVCSLEAPFLSSRYSRHEPTIRSPYDETMNNEFVYVRLVQLIAYDSTTGLVYRTEAAMQKVP